MLPDEEAEKWLRRFQERRSPYARVRRHLIRRQLDAVVALALHLGLTRAQIFRLSVNDLHFENAAVVVRDRTGLSENAREVPLTHAARESIWYWLECRAY